MDFFADAATFLADFAARLASLLPCFTTRRASYLASFATAASRPFRSPKAVAVRLAVATTFPAVAPMVSPALITVSSKESAEVIGFSLKEDEVAHHTRKGGKATGGKHLRKGQRRRRAGPRSGCGYWMRTEEMRLFQVWPPRKCHSRRSATSLPVLPLPPRNSRPLYTRTWAPPKTRMEEMSSPMSPSSSRASPRRRQKKLPPKLRSR